MLHGADEIDQLPFTFQNKYRRIMDITIKIFEPRCLAWVRVVVAHSIPKNPHFIRCKVFNILSFSLDDFFAPGSVDPYSQVEVLTYQRAFVSIKVLAIINVGKFIIAGDMTQVKNCATSIPVILEMRFRSLAMKYLVYSLGISTIR